METIFRNGWLLFIAVTCVNAAIWWHRAQPRITATPELESGYRNLIRGWLICFNVPWLVMGAGILAGAVPSVLSYFNPRNGPFVIAFYISVVAVWIVLFYWMFFRHGAEQLASHPGLINLPVNQPWMIKRYFLVCLVGGAVGLCLMIFGNYQVR